jgi:hypothetical protein
MIAAFSILAALSLSLPTEYKPRDETSERIELPGPPGQFATQMFRSCEAPTGNVRLPVLLGAAGAEGSRADAGGSEVAAW